MKSREKGLITKEHTVKHAHLNFALTWVLYFSKLAMKLLKVVQSCFKPYLLTQQSTL